jgi:chromosome partitioning protein
MTKVISFISRKGGTGKTTIAINLATSLHQMGKIVSLIETDTNYTLSTLRNIELQEQKKNVSGFEIYGSEDESITDDIDRFRGHHELDYLIVDSAGKTTTEYIKHLALKSNLIVIPTSLTKNDFLVTYQTVEDLKPAKEHNPGLQICLLPNRIHFATKPETIEQALQPVDARILKNRLTQKNIYANFSTINAEPEFKNTAKEILELLS